MFVIVHHTFRLFRNTSSIYLKMFNIYCSTKCTKTNACIVGEESCPCRYVCVSADVLQLHTPSPISADAKRKSSFGSRTQECPSHVLITPPGTEEPTASPDLFTPLHHNQPRNIQPQQRSSTQICGAKLDLNRQEKQEYPHGRCLWGLMTNFKLQRNQCPSEAVMRKISKHIIESFIFNHLPYHPWGEYSTKMHLKKRLQCHKFI